MVGIAAGLAAGGQEGVLPTPSPCSRPEGPTIRFATRVAYPGLNVTIVGSHGGLTAGEDGGTHQCIEDLSADAHGARHDGDLPLRRQ